MSETQHQTATPGAPDPNLVTGSVFDGLVAGGGTAGSHDDPLAGIDTAVPPGVGPRDLATYALMLADDALVLSHRLSEWCSRAPDLEDDVALANIALDLLGQARMLLARAAAADPSVVPALPHDSPVPPEDALAFFREPEQFRNHRMAELANGDFAHAVVRLLLCSVMRLALLQRLRGGRDPVLAAVAAKAVAEVTYHRDYAGRWVRVLAGGTTESRRRVGAALSELWPHYPELLATHPVEAAVAAAGAGVDPATVADDVEAVLDRVLDLSGLDRPEGAAAAGVAGVWESTGRHGVHTDDLGRMLEEMQSVARAHPGGTW